MPDPQATPPEAAPSATPPVAPPITTQPDFQLTDDARAAGFTEAHFAHPEYGKATKELYKGFQKRSEESAKAKKDLADWKAFINANPDVRTIVMQTVRKLNGLPPEEAPPKDDPDDQTRHDDLSADLALQELYAHLGKGDPYAGRVTYAKEWAEDVQAELPLLVGKPSERLRKAMEIVTLRRGHRSTVATPPPPPPPDTSAASETDRGTASDGAPKKETDFSDEAIMMRALKKHGVTDLTEFAKLTGALR